MSQETKSDKSNKSDANSSVRSYTTPKLKLHGSLEQLTKGTVGTNDPGGSSGGK